MGNRVGKIGYCFAGEVSRRHDIAVILGDPFHGGIGHSFCYVPSDQACISSSKVHSEFLTAVGDGGALYTGSTFFRSISGASVSANASTQTLSAALIDSSSSSAVDPASTFESSDSFASLPLQPVPRSSVQSGSGTSTSSGPIERGFLSGPIERGFISGPIDRGLYSGPIGNRGDQQSKLSRSLSHNGFVVDLKSKKQRIVNVFKKAISRTMKSFKGVKESEFERSGNNECVKISAINSNTSYMTGQMSLNSEGSLVDEEDSNYSMKSQNLQWAQGKAGEDRVHIVVSEGHGWVFVGIYDGFNGPDAPDFLLSNLYSAVHKELKGLLWNDKFESVSNSSDKIVRNFDVLGSGEENFGSGDGDSKKRKKKGCDEKRWRLELDWKSKEKTNSGVNHSDVLKALSQALKNTEDSYLEIADKMVMENPELALMGSCVLVMLMKGEDVYLMNVGDSRAVLARKTEPNFGLAKARKDLQRIREETKHDIEALCGNEPHRLNNLCSVQLTVDHSTYEEEV